MKRVLRFLKGMLNELMRASPEGWCVPPVQNPDCPEPLVVICADGQVITITGWCMVARERLLDVSTVPSAFLC